MAFPAAAFSMPMTASATPLFSNSHDYSFGSDPTAVNILVEVFDNFAGDFSKYEWRYTVTNNSYEPAPGTSNGFSGFETTLPAAVPDLLSVCANCSVGIRLLLRSTRGVGYSELGGRGSAGRRDWRVRLFVAAAPNHRKHRLFPYLAV